MQRIFRVFGAAPPAALLRLALLAGMLLVLAFLIVPWAPSHAQPAPGLAMQVPTTTLGPSSTPTPRALSVFYVPSYPVRGTEMNSSMGAIRVLVRVVDGGGSPVTGATVTVDVESETLTEMGDGYYGGSGGCWVSAAINYADRTVTVTAAKSGYSIGVRSASTADNPHVNSCPPLQPPPTMTPSPTWGGVPTPTPTSRPTSTWAPTPTLQALHITYASGFPCRGMEMNPNRGYIRILVRVVDEGGNPISDAVVIEDLEGTSLTYVGDGYYGSGSTCWRSANFYGDEVVRVTANRTGFIGAFIDGNTIDNPICNSCNVPTLTPTPTFTASPTYTPETATPTPTPGTPTASPQPTYTHTPGTLTPTSTPGTPTASPWPTYTPLPTIPPEPTIPPIFTASPSPTYTPFWPTYTPLPTYSPEPTWTPGTPTPTVTCACLPTETATSTPSPAEEYRVYLPVVLKR